MSTNTLAQRTLEEAQESALALLPQADQKPFKQALLRAIATEVHEWETETFKLIVGRALDFAIGAHIDQVGALLREPRKGRTDPTYTLALRVVVRARKSAGKVNDILAILDLLGYEYHYSENSSYPAGFFVEVFGEAGTEVASWIRKARLGGVKAQTVFYDAPRAQVWQGESTYGGTPITGNVQSSIYGPALGFPGASVRES